MKIPILLILTTATLSWAPTLRAANAPTPEARANHSFKLEIRNAIDRGLQWMAADQAEDGHWSNPNHPALTALPLWAFAADPARPTAKRHEEVIRKARAHLVSRAQEDGSFHATKELVNYNTATTLTALSSLEDPELRPLLLAARAYLARGQWDFDQPGVLDNPLDGGIGYGGSYPHSDMSNTLLALEAMYHSRHLVSEKEVTQELDWDAVRHFISRCQNLPESNPEPWVSGDEQNRGGFVYYPGNSKAGEMKLENGRTALRSYGSISYAGLLSFVYADVNKDDPRVQAVIAWLEKNYTLEENPGMGPQGLFYYYHTMAKALTAAGITELQAPDGTRVDWRKSLAMELLNRQREDGSWKNDHARWWENNPVLASAYSILALEMIDGGI